MAMVLWMAEAENIIKSIRVAYNQMVQNIMEDMGEQDLVIRSSIQTLVKTDSACAESRHQALMSTQVHTNLGIEECE